MSERFENFNHKIFKNPEETEKLQSIIDTAVDVQKNPEATLEDIPGMFYKKNKPLEVREENYFKLKEQLEKIKETKKNTEGMIPDELYRQIFTNAKKIKDELDNALLKNEYSEKDPRFHQLLQQKQFLDLWLEQNESVPGNPEELEQKINTLEELLTVNPQNN